MADRSIMLEARRQPVHTVYGGGHLFRADTARKLGDVALRLMDEHAAWADTFESVLGIPQEFASTVYDRVRAKLEREPVEDFRIDFEDGYGNRTDDEEDGHVRSAASEVAKGFANDTLPPYIGTRIKPFSPELTRRSLRTLELFINELFHKGNTGLVSRFFVTLPKLTEVKQPARLAEALYELEGRLGLGDQSLRFEIMVETPQTLFTSTGAE